MEITEPVVLSIQLQIGQKTETEINRLPQVMSMVHFPPHGLLHKKKSLRMNADLKTLLHTLYFLDQQAMFIVNK